MTASIARILKRTALGLGALLLCALVAALIWRAVRQHEIAAATRITEPGGIDSLEKIRLGGVEQWITLRGHDRGLPVLLFLHGGPGLPEMPFSYVNAALEKHFVVVEWDQRGAGKSFDPAIPAASMTFEQLVVDAEELVVSLTSRFQQPRIFLVGHSSGSVIGVLLAARRPDLLRAYVGLGQVADLQMSEKLLYRYATEHAARDSNRKAQEQLAAIGPPPFAGERELRISQKWVNHFASEDFGGMHPSRLELAFFSPRASLLDYWRIVRGAKFSFDHLWRELFAVNLFTQAPRLEVPVYFLLGRQDRVVTGEVAAKYFAALQAPKGKELFWFEHSGHWPQLQEPGKFERIMVERVRAAE